MNAMKDSAIVVTWNRLIKPLYTFLFIVGLLFFVISNLALVKQKAMGCSTDLDMFLYYVFIAIVAIEWRIMLARIKLFKNAKLFEFCNQGAFRWDELGLYFFLGFLGGLAIYFINIAGPGKCLLKDLLLIDLEQVIFVIQTVLLIADCARKFFISESYDKNG